MKNYAMIPINRRYDKQGKRYVRRILISYSRKVSGIYQKVEIVAKDPYFDDPDASHQYVFKPTYFYLKKDAYEADSFLVNEKRKYEFESNYLIDTAIEFQAKTAKEAIEKFKNRKENH